jgi:hypothetical protein
MMMMMMMMTKIQFFNESLEESPHDVVCCVVLSPFAPHTKNKKEGK